MKTISLLFALSIFVVFPAFATDLRITTGSETGTYIKFGNEIARAVESVGINLTVETSQGSVQNLKRLLGYEGFEDSKYFQLAIIQADVLADLRRAAKGNKTLEEIVGRVKVVLPLYDEEVHIFVREDSSAISMSDIADDEWIAVGKPQSGTYLTARLLYQLAGKEWIVDQLDPLGAKDGVDSLKFGSSGAVFSVAGAPSSFGTEYIKSEDNLRMLNIVQPTVFDFAESPYKRATIPAGTYPWLDEPVETAAVGSLLVAFGYASGENCDAIALLTRTIIDSLDSLRKNGHQKWNQVDPANAAGRRDLYECVRPVYDALQ